MSVSQKQAVITLIEKKGKDRSSLENWWLISLLNVDTKIMTNCPGDTCFGSVFGKRGPTRTLT